MNRSELERFISEVYNTDADYPWDKYPDYAVFRHRDSKKWFALVMRIPRARLGLTGGGALDVVNLKCDPTLIGSMRLQPGVFPAYHMSKASWLTVALDGTAPDETVKMLLDLSFGLTAPKRRKPRA